MARKPHKHAEPLTRMDIIHRIAKHLLVLLGFILLGYMLGTIVLTQYVHR